MTSFTVTIHDIVTKYSTVMKVTLGFFMTYVMKYWLCHDFFSVTIMTLVMIKTKFVMNIGPDLVAKKNGPHR